MKQWYFHSPPKRLERHHLDWDQKVWRSWLVTYQCGGEMGWGDPWATQTYAALRAAGQGTAGHHRAHPVPKSLTPPLPYYTMKTCKPQRWQHYGLFKVTPRACRTARPCYKERNERDVGKGATVTIIPPLHTHKHTTPL